MAAGTADRESQEAVPTMSGAPAQDSLRERALGVAGVTMRTGPSRWKIDAARLSGSPVSISSPASCSTRNGQTACHG